MNYPGEESRKHLKLDDLPLPKGMPSAISAGITGPVKQKSDAPGLNVPIVIDSSADLKDLLSERMNRIGSVVHATGTSLESLRRARTALIAVSGARTRSELRVLCYPDIPRSSDPFRRHFKRIADAEGKELVLVRHNPSKFDGVFGTFMGIDEMATWHPRTVVRRRGKTMVYRK